MTTPAIRLRVFTIGGMSGKRFGPTPRAGHNLVVLAQGPMAPDDRTRILERVAARSSRAESGGALGNRGAPSPDSGYERAHGHGRCCCRPGLGPRPA